MRKCIGLSFYIPGSWKDEKKRMGGLNDRGTVISAREAGRGKMAKWRRGR